jgi:hypothetical protein
VRKTDEASMAPRFLVLPESQEQLPLKALRPLHRLRRFAAAGVRFARINHRGVGR